MRILEAEPVRGRYFYHQGRPGVAPVDDDIGGAFYRTSVFLLPGQSHTFSCPYPENASSAQTFFVRYMLMASGALDKSLFLPAELEGKAIYLAASNREVSRLRSDKTAYADVLCASAGRMDGFRFQIGAP